MITKTAKDAVNDATLARAMGRGGNTPSGVINSETNWAPLKSGKSLFNRLDAVAKPNTVPKASSTGKRKNNTSSRSAKKQQPRKSSVQSKKSGVSPVPVIAKEAPKPVAPIAKPVEKPTVVAPVKPVQKPAQSSYAETLGSYLANKVRNAVRSGRDFLRDSARGYKDLYNFVTDKQFRTQLGF